jgi:hypothetical protein
LHRLFDRLFGDANGVLAAAEKAFSGAQHFLVFGVGRYAAFDTGHLDLLESSAMGRTNASHSP